MILYVGGHFANTKNNAVSRENSNSNNLMMASVACAVLLMRWGYRRFTYVHIKTRNSKTSYGATPAMMCYKT